MEPLPKVDETREPFPFPRHPFPVEGDPDEPAAPVRPADTDQLTEREFPFSRQLFPTALPKLPF